MKSELQEMTERAAEGDLESERQLIEFFLPRALTLARGRIGGMNQAVSDPEDLANSAIKSLCLRIRDGRIEFTHDHQMLALLRAIVTNKANRFVEISSGRKRSMARNAESAEDDLDVFRKAGISPADMFLNDGTIDIERTDHSLIVNILTSLETELHGLFKALINSLDPYPRKVMLLLLERDYSNEELANKVGRSLNSVARYRSAIRDSLNELVAS